MHFSWELHPSVHYTPFLPSQTFQWSDTLKYFLPRDGLSHLAYIHLVFPPPSPKRDAHKHPELKVIWKSFSRTYQFLNWGEFKLCIQLQIACDSYKEELVICYSLSHTPNHCCTQQCLRRHDIRKSYTCLSPQDFGKKWKNWKGI